MIRSFTLLLVGIVSYQLTSSQTLNWAWSKNPQGNGSDYGSAITTDALGNLYAVGTFSGPSISFGSHTLVNNGGTAMYLTKYNSNGDVVWAKTFGGTNNNPWSVTTDNSGNVYVGGTFSNLLAADGITLNGVDPISDIFILKLDGNGNTLWGRAAGGTGVDNLWSVKADNIGNVYIAGDFHSNILRFDSVKVNGGVSNGKMYLAKYTGNGEVLWARTSEGSNNSVAYSVSTDASGYVFITGAFASPGITFGNDVLKNKGGSTVFLAKYDSNGSPLWGRGGSGAGFENSNAVINDATGNVYITGYFPAEGIRFENTQLNSSGRNDLFIVKYDANGNLLWAKSAGGDRGDVPFSLATGTNGSIYVAGYFKSASIEFGSATLNNGNPGNPDIFIAKYDSDGNAITAAGAGGSDDDEAYGITSDLNGNIYATGFFFSRQITCGSTDLHNSGVDGSSDAFVAKLNSLLSSETFNSKNSDNPMIAQASVTISPNPASDFFRISLSQSALARLEVYDVAGKRVLEKTISNKETIVNCKNFLPGIYFVRVLNRKDWFSKKIIVQ